MKKGASHVDWAIGMALFLVYVLLMFIFLKPSTEPTYDENDLLNMVYLGLKNDTGMTAQKKYLIITPQGGDLDENKEYSLRIRNPEKNGMSDEWITSDRSGSNHLVLINDSLGKVYDQNLTVTPFDFKNDKKDDYPTKQVLEIKTKLKKGNNTFWFLYSEDTKFLPPHYEAEIKFKDEDCTDEIPGGPDGPKIVYNCLLDEKDPTPVGESRPLNFTYQFGVIETFTAFSEEKLNMLKAEYDTQYEALKTNWSFPTDKNFNITIELLS